MAARKRKIRHDENTRQKIQVAQIINRLTKHINGKVEMSATQVSAALGLLRKTLPDLATQQIEHSGEVTLERIERVIVDDRPALQVTDIDAYGNALTQEAKQLTH